MLFKQVLADRARNFADKPAIIFKDRVVSFAGLQSQAEGLRDALLNAGIRKGDKVGVFLPNCPEYIFSYLALFSLGAVVVPLDFMLTENEVIGFLNHSDARAVIAAVKKGVELLTVKQQCSFLENIIVLSEDVPVPSQDGFHSLADLMRTRPTTAVTPDVTNDDTAAIFYTSGSTGHPKGVVLTYGHFDHPVRSIDHFLDVSDEDTYLCAGVPFSHIGGLDYILFMLAFGSTLVLMDRFQPLETLKMIEGQRATILCIVPSMFVAILSLKGSDKFDLSSLRYAVVFGAPSSPALLKRFNRLCPNASLRNGWGMTETAAPNTLSPEDVNKLNSIGPFGCGMDARIVDLDGADVAAGERGELWVKGPAVMSGYYKEEILTQDVLTADGWLKTGDVAICQEGLYYLVGRIKEMLKVAGEIVFAPEVEAVIHRHPAVADVAVVGLPDDLRGEVPKAFVTLNEGAQLEFNELRDFCKEHLAHFKLPHHLEVLPELPKNRIGKVDKESLKTKN